MGPIKERLKKYPTVMNHSNIKIAIPGLIQNKRKTITGIMKMIKPRINCVWSRRIFRPPEFYTPLRVLSPTSMAEPDHLLFFGGACGHEHLLFWYPQKTHIPTGFPEDILWKKPCPDGKEANAEDQILLE